MGRAALFAVFAAATLSTLSAADRAAAQPTRRLLVAAPLPPPRPATTPPPSMKLTITAISPTSSWRMRVENTGDVPLRLTADARLLSFELTAPGARRPLRCALPADMRPTNDTDRALIVPPKRAYAETFDPRFYCFGAAEASALVAGATMVAHLGWPLPAHARAATPPFEVSPIEGVAPVVSAVNELVSEAFTIPAEPKPSEAVAAVGPDPAAPEAFPTKLALSVPAHVEAWRILDVAIPVTVTNKGPRPVTMLYRPETIGFDIVGPQGVARCEWPSRPPAPVRDAYATVPPRGQLTVPVILTSVCPSNTFDRAGLFIIRPRLDTRHAGGARIGLRTFDGEVIGTTTTVLRIHHGRVQPLWQRPRLEEP